MINKKIIFCGDLSQNNGPAYVNKCLNKYMNCIFIDTKYKNKLVVLFKFLYYLVFSDIIIFSSLYRVNFFLFKIAKLFRKKTIYFMHGYSNFDLKINKENNYDSLVLMENHIFEKCDLILIVSKMYFEFLKKELPQFTSKMHYLMSGIDKNFFDDLVIGEKKENSIAVCGGNRFIKNNSFVCEAVNNLNNRDVQCNLSIYGLLYENNEVFIENDHIKILGRVSQKELFNELAKTKLFILNSQYESFGLSLIDALMCGCNILVTKNAGVTTIMDLEENDIIFDPKNVVELENKIKYNLEHSNNQRILNSIDFDHYSWQNVSKRFIMILNCLLNNEDFKIIK